MYKLFLAFVLFFAFTAVNAQEKTDYQTISRIKDEELNHSQVMDILFNLSEVSGPRLTGSTNLKNAQTWAMQQMKDWGLQNIQLEAWGGFGKGWQVEKSYAALTVPYYQPLITIPKAWTPGTNGLIKGEVNLMKIKAEEDLAKYKGKLSGKIVVLIIDTLEVKQSYRGDSRRLTDDDLHNLYMDRNLEEDSSYRIPSDRMNLMKTRGLRNKAAQFLIDEGVALVLTGRGGTDGTFFTSNGASYSMTAKPAVPELEMGSEHLNQITRLIGANKKVEIEAEIKTKFLDQDSLQYNVIGEIPGTDKKLKNEIVMIGAHLDSWHAATGATDNGAGSAIMLEVMRILKDLDVKPRRTIRIALWSGEEQGILGSKNYVKKHFANPETMELQPEHSLLSAYYNLDNGSGKLRGIYTQGNDALRPIFSSWLEPFNDMGATTVTNRSTGSTDHIPFDNVGLPGFQFIQDPLDYGTRTHHTNMDTYDRAVKSDMQQAAIIIATSVYNTAQRDEKLPRKQLPKAKSAASATPATTPVKGSN